MDDIKHHVYGGRQRDVNQQDVDPPDNSSVKKQAIHPSLARLLAYARDATASQTKERVVDLASLRARLAISSQLMDAWYKRGVSKAGAIDAERIFGCSPNWLLRGHERPKPTAMLPSTRLSAEEPRSQYKPVADAEWALLQDLRILPEDERQALVRDVRARATKYRAYEREVLARLGSTTLLDK